MQKSIGVLWLALGLGCLWAEKPRRYVELGFNLETGFANNYLTYTDFFNDDRIIHIDLNSMGRYDFNLAGDVSAKTFLTINGEGFSVGLFTGLAGLFYGSLSEELFRLLNEGNTSPYSQADLALGGSLFAEAGIQIQKQIGKLRFMISPAVFLPLVVIPKPKTMSLIVKTGEETMSVTGDFTVDIYSPVALGTGETFSVDTGKLSKALDSGALGFDVSLGAEYPLFSILDAGLLVRQIPIGLSRLTYRTQIQAAFGFNTIASEQSLLDMLKEGRIEDMLMLEDPDVSFSRGLIYVVRPLRVDLYGRIRFLGHFLVLRPYVGLSLFTPYGDVPCFNGGLEGQINLWRLLSMSVSSEYTDLLWKHRIGFILNLRVLQLDLGVSTQSQEFTRSFQLSGLGASLGLHIGF
ncbi:MAG: hypothetical protein LBQ30_03845 [Treponema sp.]|nr:hypothetical protein [Treponema sp.]